MILGSLFVVAAIHLDQAGYPSVARKVAAITTPATTFTVHRVPDGLKVFEGPLSSAVVDPDSGDRVQLADFTPLETGRYELRAGSEKAQFRVADDPYESVLRLASRSYYGQRCNVAVDLAPGYAHGACHREGAFHPSSGRTGKVLPAGGWHDAGDYGRYVVNSGISTATLLWAYEIFGFDMLEEIRWNVDWMRSMQDNDGGVWHKQTSLQFAPYPMRAEDDRSVSYVIGKGSCATANFAAVMAIASRVYDDKSYLDAAKRAWKWLEANPEVFFTNPPDVGTGEYGDTDCRDERLWAAAEIARTSSDPAARQYFLANMDEAVGSIRAASPPSWRELGPFAAWTYALTEAAPDIHRRTVETANAIVARASKHPYRIPLTTDDYLWGSNAVALNYALHLLIANRLQPDTRYVEAARDILHYLFGRNTFSLSFVTGVGTHSVMHPHHRPSASDNHAAPWPGLLAGGPNRQRQDDVLRALPPDTPPARMYADDERSYAGNEIAINWNAPLVFVLAGVSQPR